jgi:cell division protein FtsI (penicillin-binding protein 3)
VKTKTNSNRTIKIALLFFILLFFIIIFVINLLFNVLDYRKIPSLKHKKEELAVRGNIISSDGFKLAQSIKIYKASIDIRCLDPYKKDLFVKLFSIYSDIPEDKIEEKLKIAKTKKQKRVILSYNISSKTAKNLKELGYKLRRFKVFKPILTSNNKKIIYGLDIKESGEKREYLYKDSLEPLLGYISKFETKKNKTKVKGIKGLEYHYNEMLNDSSNGIMQGSRDALSNIALDKNSKISPREDGIDIHLNISLKLQKHIEVILDNAKQEYNATNIIASVMDSKSGNILALATSNRFNPLDIKRDEYSHLNIHAVERPYEPGSIIKPISLAIVMEHNLVKSGELISAYNRSTPNAKGEYKRGKYKLGRYTIKDDHRFKKNYITPTDTIINSSNIGILQLAQRLSGVELYNGMKEFGFMKYTGIDLSHEKKGVMPSIDKLSRGESSGKDNIYKATLSYGQGMTSTFMQSLKAYTIFNNDGVITSPKLISKAVKGNGEVLRAAPEKEHQVISSTVANRIKRMLINTVKRGTGFKAQYDGLEVGGKTGTAQVARGGEYKKRYISSFFGFANDEKSKYTIGVTVFDPIATGEKWYYHYASQSAAPIFRDITEALVDSRFLVPNEN